jgi:hypothetical protein
MKRGFVLAASCLLALGGALLSGCDKDKPAQPPQEEEARAKPTLRIYAVSGAAGAIEPCGCVKDMLGGIDHAAAWIASQKKQAPESLVVGAGPMFFADPEVKEAEREQALFKAEAMAASLKDLGLAAWAPGANDWALGVEKFSGLAKETGAQALAGNLAKDAGSVTATHLVEAGGMKVGLIGVSIPEYAGGKVEFEIADAKKSLSQGTAALKKQGAQIMVALVAAQRGKALRLIEESAGLQLAVIGKAYDQGEANDPPFSPEVVGETLVAQAPNHLQGVSVVDLFVRGGDHSFADGSGLESLGRRSSFEGRISTLEKRLAEWKKKGSGAKASDIADREKELAGLKKELAALPTPKAPVSGSYFLYDLNEVRESAGEDGRVASRLVAYYRRVNEHNKKAFADKTPRPAEEGQSSYVGIDVCSNCHLEERAVWDKTAHAGAYETLSTDHKEFNLDCVSCHVTGYEKPGGSTVTHVEKLTDVQCEVCHGPGSRHVENPGDKELIRAIPSRTLCASACHHPPHVGPEWSVDEAWPKILGKGHQFPKKN